VRVPPGRLDVARDGPAREESDAAFRASKKRSPIVVEI
jgi:hypothetical protein